MSASIGNSAAAWHVVCRQRQCECTVRRVCMSGLRRLCSDGDVVLAVSVEGEHKKVGVSLVWERKDEAVAQSAQHDRRDTADVSTESSSMFIDVRVTLVAVAFITWDPARFHAPSLLTRLPQTIQTARKGLTKTQSILTKA